MRKPNAGVDFIPQSWIYEFGYWTIIGCHVPYFQDSNPPSLPLPLFPLLRSPLWTCTRSIHFQCFVYGLPACETDPLTSFGRSSSKVKLCMCSLCWSQVLSYFSRDCNKKIFKVFLLDFLSIVMFDVIFFCCLVAITIATHTLASSPLLFHVSATVIEIKL